MFFQVGANRAKGSRTGPTFSELTPNQNKGGTLMRLWNLRTLARSMRRIPQTLATIENR